MKEQEKQEKKEIQEKLSKLQLNIDKLPEIFQINQKVRYKALKDYDNTTNKIYHFVDIKDILEKDKLFPFLVGLQLWARMEIMRQRPESVADAMPTVERLNDYIVGSNKRKALILPTNGAGRDNGFGAGKGTELALVTGMCLVEVWVKE